MKYIWTMWLMPILENAGKINAGTRHQTSNDQMACAVGGLITIDFVEPMTPVVQKIDFDFRHRTTV